MDKLISFCKKCSIEMRMGPGYFSKGIKFTFNKGNSTFKYCYSDDELENISDELVEFSLISMLVRAFNLNICSASDSKDLTMNDYSLNAQQAFNAAINILAVEYLIKTNNYTEYCRQCDQLDKLDQQDLEILHIYLSLNMHVRNLGEMITQGDYEYQVEELKDFLDRKENQHDR